MLNKLSLRARITALSAIIFTAMCVILTTLMIISAGTVFSPSIDHAATIIYSQNSSITTTPEGVSDSSNQLNQLYALQGTARQDYTVQSIILLVVIVLTGTAAVWFITGHALKPITNLSRMVENIDENNLSEKVPIPPTNDEVSHFSELITSHVVMEKKDRKYEYKANFSVAVHICREFLLGKNIPPNIEALIARYITPIRPGRSRPRDMKVKQTISFMYRVA